MINAKPRPIQTQVEERFQVALDRVVGQLKTLPYVTDRAVTGPGPDRRVVFQNYSLLPWPTVGQNVHEAVDSVCGHRGTMEVEYRVEQSLKMVGLWEHQD